MPAISKWMIGFGLLLLGSAVVAWALQEAFIRAGISNGLAMIAAGAASAQGRRSLRRAGLLVGFLLPAITAALFGWRGIEQWNLYRGGFASIQSPLYAGAVAASAAFVVLVLVRLRAAQQSEIAERGYSVTTPTLLQTGAHCAENRPDRA